jgi:ferredoxin
MRLTVDHNVCMRSGQCSYLHPELFTEREDGFPVVLVDRPDEELLTAAEEAAELCPSGAIQLVEDEET